MIEYARMKKRVFSLAFFGALILGILLLVPAVPYARAANVRLENPLGPNTNSLTNLLEKIIKWMVDIGAPVAVAVIIYGGAEMLLAGGNPEKFKSGKNTIVYAVVGYGIIAIGWGIVSIIESLLQ